MNFEEFKLRCEIIERYGEDSEEHIAHRRRFAVEDERMEFGSKTLMVIFFIVLALIGSNGYAALLP
jgi:hypothetical protein